MIPQNFIDEIQQKTDIVEIISSYLPLKRAGRNFKTQCPFHNEKTPSFIVSPQKQIFHCFGCGEGGGVLQFIMLYEKVNFVEAVELLAKRLGIVIPHQKLSSKDRLKTILYDVTAQASMFYHNNLLKLKENHPVKQYLKKRGLNDEVIEKFRIGFSYQGKEFSQFMRSKGYTLDVLEKASLIIMRRDGGYSDMFRNRIMFPIFDVRSRVIGFGARSIVDQNNVPKYINSIESILYNKRNNLFGLNLSKDEIVKKDSVIITEGYLDMITPYANGFKNIVASLGTALTAEQIRLLKRYTENIILVFDADKAGQNATIRAIDILIENGVLPKVLNIPKGLDPDSLIRTKGSDVFEELLSRVEDFFDFKIKILLALYDVDTIEGKTKIAAQMIETIVKLGSEIQKYEYVKKLAKALKVNEEIILAELNKSDGKKNRYRKEEKKEDLNLSVPLVERLILKFICTNDKVLKVLSKQINANDFIHPTAKKIYSYMVERFSHQENISTQQMLISIEDKKARGLITNVLVEDMGELTKDTLKDCINKVKENRDKLLCQQLQEQIKAAEKDKDMKRRDDLLKKFTKMNTKMKKR